MRHGFCGLDFGTSNSTLGLGGPQGCRLCPLEGEQTALPSAIFFDYEQHSVHFGRDAIALHIEGAQGRLMRALKSVLGSPLIHETTSVQRRRVVIRDIIGMFIRHLKKTAENHRQQEIGSVVLGRPVRFVDDDDESDRRAEAELTGIARAQGFRQVETQFEPVAAALAYEQQLDREQLALIVDLGGGTSDFAIVRLSPVRAKKLDRSADILCRSGVHVGGTDFDRQLSIAHVLPYLGYDTVLGAKRLPMPRELLHDLATWHKVAFLYTPQTLNYLRSVRNTARDPQLIDSLIEVIADRKGHQLLAAVEAAKITLSDADRAIIRIDTHDPVDVTIAGPNLAAAVDGGAAKIVAAVERCCREAGIVPADLQSIFMTGGSTAIPEIRRRIHQGLPDAKVVDGDLFGSVGLGLAIDAARRFA